SFLYAFLISSSVAFLPIPSVLYSAMFFSLELCGGCALLPSPSSADRSGEPIASLPLADCCSSNGESVIRRRGTEASARSGEGGGMGGGV
ncbi:hypothetical protein PENTCL1PPCAC_19283, partial [Pristionchus entomophagus]